MSTFTLETEMVWVIVDGHRLRLGTAQEWTNDMRRSEEYGLVIGDPYWDAGDGVLRVVEHRIVCGEWDPESDYRLVTVEWPGGVETSYREDGRA